MAKLWSNRIIQELDGDAAPYAGAKLFTYEAGSSTKEATYQDADGTTAHANPIVLDANGRIPAGVFLTEGQSYKFVLAPSDDTDPPASPIWTLDDIEGINDANISVDEWQASNLTPTYVSAVSFTVPGDQTSTLHVGRRLKVTDAGGSKYVTIVTSVFTTLTTVTVAGDSLATPVSDVAYGLVSADDPSISPDMVYRKAANVASDTTTDIWKVEGDLVHITGTTTITGLGTAPYAGDERTVIFDDALTLTHNATTLKLPGGQNITTVAGDRMIVRADTTANMTVIAYTATGQSPAGYRFLKRTVYTTGSGTHTYDARTRARRVILVGAGGGSGGVDGQGASTSGGGGAGGAGGYVDHYTTTIASEAYAVGAAGAAGASGANNGTAGGDTTFGSLTAGGGGLGAGATGGSASAAAGGAGGTATGGDINVVGQKGADSRWDSNVMVSSGPGGSNPLGMGGAVGDIADGGVGTGYGAGGGPPVTSGTTANQAGAAGTAGIIIVEEFV